VPGPLGIAGVPRQLVTSHQVKKPLPLSLPLARLELRAGHFDRAEAVLRPACQANPSIPLIFVLAETLIAQGKIEAHDQAAGSIDRLRQAELGDTLVQYLEAEILVRQQNWRPAIERIEIARAILQSSIPGKGDTTRPRPSSARSCAAIPTTSRHSIPWPGCWPCGIRARPRRPWS
jgi:hypothetical protein